jgi:hypothetical protein
LFLKIGRQLMLFEKLRKNRYVILAAQFVLPACLIVAAFISTFKASSYLSGSSDDLVYPYLFQHIKLHNLLLPGQHANILKFPLFLAQALLPYNYKSFMVVTVGLTVVSLVLWLIIVARITSKLSLAVIAASLACTVLGSGLFIYEITGTTIRNIEYPIALLFVIACSKMLVPTARYSRKNKYFIGISAILFTLTCAGDSFFIYTVVPTLLLALLVTYLRFGVKHKKRGSLKWPATLILGTALIAFITPRALGHLGIARFYTNPVLTPHVLALSHLGPSISTASTQLLDMVGANIFGLTVSPKNALAFFNFGLLILGTVGLLAIIYRAVSSKKSDDRTERHSLIFTTAAIAYFAVFVIYIVSDLVVVQNANGSFMSAGQDRYLTFMPLLLGFGIADMVRHISMLRLKVGLLIIAACAVLLSTGIIRHNVEYSDGLKLSEISVAKTVEAYKATEIVSGYWYGASTKFWSHNQLNYATVAACNAPQPVFNNRVSFYTPGGVSKSALVIVRNGPDAPYWQGCSDEQLRSIYGTPVKVINLDSEYTPSIWIYNYDVRTRIGPISM